MVTNTMRADRDIDRVTRGQPFEQRRIGERDAAGAERDGVAFRYLDVFAKLAETQLWAAQVRQHRDVGPVRARARRTCAACSRGVAWERFTRSTSTPESRSRSSVPGAA